MYRTCNETIGIDQFDICNKFCVQTGGTNTFTNPEKTDRVDVTAEDFFKAGDEFTVQKYGEFFKDDKFDNGEEFGYSIKVESISGSGKDAKAVIKITKQ